MNEHRSGFESPLDRGTTGFVASMLELTPRELRLLLKLENAENVFAKHPMVRANERTYSSLSEKMVRTFGIAKRRRNRQNPREV